MDPLLFLRTEDAMERMLMQKVAEATFDLERQIGLERASQIASEVSKLFPKS